MMLTHYSREPIEEILSIEPGSLQVWNNKPDGLWVSLNGGWEDWCRVNRFDDIQGKFQYRVHLAEQVKFCELKTLDDVIKLEESCGYTSSKYGFEFIDHCVDWDEVALNYNGVMLDNYSRSYGWPIKNDEGQYIQRRWYDSWDCNSGCIWDAEAIDHLELIREPIEKRVAA